MRRSTVNGHVGRARRLAGVRVLSAATRSHGLRSERWQRQLPLLQRSPVPQSAGCPSAKAGAGSSCAAHGSTAGRGKDSAATTMHRDHRGARPSRMRRDHTVVSLVPQRARGFRALRELQDPRQVWRGRRAGLRHPWNQVDFAGVPAAFSFGSTTRNSSRSMSTRRRCTTA